MVNYILNFDQFNESQRSEEIHSDDAFEVSTSYFMKNAAERKRLLGVKNEPKAKPPVYIATPMEREKEKAKEKVLQPKLNTIYTIGEYDKTSARIIIFTNKVPSIYYIPGEFIRERLVEALRENNRGKFFKYFKSLTPIS